MCCAGSVHNPEKWNSALQQFQELVQITEKPVKRPSLTPLAPLSESNKTSKASTLMQPTFSSRRRSQVNMTPLRSSLTLRSGLSAATIEMPIMAESSHTVPDSTASLVSVADAAGSHKASQHGLRRLSSQDDMNVMENTTSHALPKVLNRKKSFTDDDLDGYNSPINRARRALMFAKHIFFHADDSNFETGSRSPSPMHILMRSSTYSHDIGKSESPATTPRKPPMLRSATCNDASDLRLPRLKTSSPNAPTLNHSSRQLVHHKALNTTPCGSARTSRCSSPATPRLYSHSGLDSPTACSKARNATPLRRMASAL